MQRLRCDIKTGSNSDQLIFMLLLPDQRSSEVKIQPLMSASRRQDLPLGSYDGRLTGAEDLGASSHPAKVFLLDRVSTLCVGFSRIVKRHKIFIRETLKRVSRLSQLLVCYIRLTMNQNELFDRLAALKSPKRSELNPEDLKRQIMR